MQIFLILNTVVLAFAFVFWSSASNLNKLVKLLMLIMTGASVFFALKVSGYIFQLA